MKWRDVVIGSIATLIVTILSGIIIFYLTRIPEKNPAEKLTYLVELSAAFESANNEVALVNVILINQGDAQAESVVGSIVFPFGIIKDKKIDASAGAASGFAITSATNKRVDFKIPYLLPKEKISVSFFMESAKLSTPTVSLKSAKSIGQKVSLLDMPPKEKISLARQAISALIPLLVGLLATLFMLFFVKHGLSRLPWGASLNNNGFVFLHKELLDVATKMLFAAVVEGKESSYAISNYATCLALKNDMDAAQKYIEAAEFLARSSHEKAVVAFNHGLIMLLAANTLEAKKSLERALKLSRKEVLFYCKNSVLFRKRAEKYPEIMGLINA